MANNTSQHILNTSATLLGICLFVITSMRFGNQIETSYVDDLTAIVAVSLTVACFFSFFSIRTKHQAYERQFETIADYLFIISLLGILATILLVTRAIIK